MAQPSPTLVQAREHSATSQAYLEVLLLFRVAREEAHRSLEARELAFHVEQVEARLVAVPGLSLWAALAREAVLLAAQLEADSILAPTNSFQEPRERAKTETALKAVRSG